MANILNINMFQLILTTPHMHIVSTFIYFIFFYAQITDSNFLLNS